MSKQPRNEFVTTNSQRKKDEAERHNARYEYEKKQAERIRFVAEENPASCSDRVIFTPRACGKTQAVKDVLITGANYRGIGNYLRGY